MTRGWKLATCVVGGVLVWAHLAIAGGPTQQFPGPVLPSEEVLTDRQAAKRAMADAPSMAADEVLVRFRKGMALQALTGFHTAVGAQFSFDTPRLSS